MKKNLYIGGYSILDLNDTKVYKQALICAEQNKPVLVYDDPERYFADTIKIDTDNDDNVVITKGGKTITITDANAVSSVGDIQPSHLYKNNVALLNDNDSYELHFVIFSNTPLQNEIDEIWSLISQGDIGYDMSDHASFLVTSIGSTTIALNVSGTEVSYNKTDFYVDVTDTIQLI